MKQLVALLVLCVGLAKAQTQVTKTIAAAQLTNVAIAVDNIAALTVTTYSGTHIVVEATFEGEYSNDLLITARQAQNKLTLGVQFSPLFEGYNDKLSAHKVVAVQLQVKIPKDKLVSVFGEQCKVTASGVFQFLQVDLHDGNVLLQDYVGEAAITTYNAPIQLSNTAEPLSATAAHGNILGVYTQNKSPRLVLKSYYGNIYLSGTK